MSSLSPQTAQAAPSSAVAAAPVSEIDVSCRLPLLVLFVSAAKWLVIAWVFELIASIKFHSPGFLADVSWLTYGRVHPAFTNSLLYGFCVQAGLGVTLWLLAQMGAASLANRFVVTAGSIFWNLGVTVGVIGILAGDSTGFEHLEMPGYAAVLVLIGYLLIGLWGVVTFHQRRERKLTASHWFLLTALFWFPWIYSTAYLLLITFPVRGIDQAVIAWWYSDNLLVVWLASVGLATIFYIAPRLVGRELHSPYLALFAYWMLILFAGWGGIPNSAPVPTWIPALSTIGTVLSVLVAPAVALNIFRSTSGLSRGAWQNSPMAFFIFGVGAFIISIIVRAVCALLDAAPSLQLSWFGPAISQLTIYGFFTMVMFGAIYIIMPRLLGIGLPWPKLVRAHLWLSVVGILLIVLPWAIGGIVQERKLDGTTQPFVQVMGSTLSFLRVSTVGDLLLLVGHLLLLTNVIGLVVGFYRARAAATYSVLTEDLFKPAGARS
jgi:cytochrome c oxidase cbb3-type subunit 1